MIKNHCDVCDAVIENNEPRVRFKKYPHEMQNEGCRTSKPCVDVTICTECLSHYTLADIVSKFERKVF